MQPHLVSTLLLNNHKIIGLRELPTPEGMAGKKNLLLCLDAFGTIYTPRAPIAAQYGAVARSMGVKIEDEEVVAGFKKAFKDESAAHPNFGKAVGMGSVKWWTNVITKTFEKYTSPSPIPPALAPTLIERFNSREGYTLFPDVQAHLDLLRHSRFRRSDSDRRIVVGVITNSDDRTPAVLSSLGLRVGSRRFGPFDSDHSTAEMEKGDGAGSFQDIDFVICSYDVGFEKPDRRVFDAATSTLRSLLAAEKGARAQDIDLEDWDLLYLGDEIDKDGVGATRAGWKAVVVDRSLGDGEAISLKRLVRGSELDVVSDFNALRHLKGRFPLLLG